MSTVTINIYRDNNLLKTFENQESDMNAFGWLLRSQSNSIDWAIKYEGWKVEVVDNETKEKTYWKPTTR